jgi:hypothetical protein
LAVYRFQYDLRRFASESRGWREFVVKPAQGAGGEGVVIIAQQQAAAFVTSSGQQLSARQLEGHLSDILGGVFSLNQRYDEALIERRVYAHSTLAQLSFRGLPDVRILVLHGVPVMAMLRLQLVRHAGVQTFIWEGSVLASIYIPVRRTRLLPVSIGLRRIRIRICLFSASLFLIGKKFCPSPPAAPMLLLWVSLALISHWMLNAARLS